MRITRFFTKKLGENSYIENKEDIKKILVIRPNHRLVNILLITPLIQEISTAFPNAKIDLFVKGGAAFQVFKFDSKINQIHALPKKHFKELITYLKVWINLLFSKYDFAINVSHESSSGNLATKLSRAKFKFFGLETIDNELPNDYFHFAKFPVYNFRAYLKKSGIKTSNQEIKKLQLELSDEEINNGKEIISNITKNDKKTIVFFTYATGAKCYSTDFWEEFHTRLKEEFEPNYNLIEILPIENVSQINFKAPTFYSKDLREIASFLHNTDLFIGADSGMMHLAATATKTVGLFNHSDKISIYQPYGDGNFGIDTNKISIEDCIKKIKVDL